MKKILLLAGVLFSLASCSEDESVQPSSMVGYRITSESDYDDPGHNDYKTVINGNLSNGKLYATTTEHYVNNSLVDSETVQRYFYTNNLLTHIIPGGNYYDDYYYDAQNRLVGATRTYDNGQHLYYRFVYATANSVYCEHINLPYNDAGAVTASRMVLTFDGQDNVIAAGFDFNLDGTPENLYTYTYSNDNMVALHKPDGSQLSYSYTTIVDSYNALAEASYGRKTLRLICSESYCSGQIDLLQLNRNLGVSATAEYSYQTLANNWYHTRTKTESIAAPAGVSIQKMEFFFN